MTSNSKLEDTGERLIVKGNEQTLTYGEHLSRYSSVLELVRGKVVLDVASGTGYGAQMLAQNAKKVIGVDYSESAVAYSKKQYGAPNVTYMVGDAHNLQLADNSIDVVVSFETIEHLKDPVQFVREVKRVLKKDGVFVVSTPNDAEFMEGNEFHIHEFEFSELQKLIKANFSNYEFYYQGTWFTAGLLSEEHFTRPEMSGDTAVLKTFGQPTKRAIFFIAIASSAQVPALQENVVIADRWSSKEDMERDVVRQDTLTTQQQTLTSLQSEHDALKERAAELDTRLRAITGTRWWKARSLAGRIKRKISG